MFRILPNKFRNVCFLLFSVFFIFSSNTLSWAECSESGDYLVCEDWDSGTPPADPWPVKDGVEWHGWEPADYGRSHPGDISTSIYHSAPRSLMLYKADGTKDTVDMSHPIPGNPSLVHIRFYMLIPDGELENIMTASQHMLFVASDASAECSLDFRGCGRNEDGQYIDSSAV